jgi:hypothetical protein
LKLKTTVREVVVWCESRDSNSGSGVGNAR